jgi:hypothetical protein
MHFSVWPSPAQPWDDIHEITAHCERTGWDGVYFADHFMPNGPGTAPLDGDILECWSVIAALAALVPRAKPTCPGPRSAAAARGWRRRAAHDADCGPVRRSLELLDDA